MSSSSEPYTFYNINTRSRHNTSHNEWKTIWKTNNKLDIHNLTTIVRVIDENNKHVCIIHTYRYMIICGYMYIYMWLYMIIYIYM